MADLGISIAEKLIEVTGSAAIKKVCEMWNYQSELEHLNTTVKTIKNVLFEADSKRDLSASEQAYIDELKAILYDADDLFDEFRTRAELNQLNSKKNHKLLKKVRHLFSSKKNEVSQANIMSKKVKEIKEQLDFVANNHKKFDLKLDMKPNRQRRETFSHLLNEKVVGRDDDKKKVIDMLLNSDIEEDVHFLTIVGVGGLGKTTLAKLVYHDEKIEKEFSNPALKLWVCVSDQDGEQFDVKNILRKILELLLGTNQFDGTSSLELVQSKFKESLKGKKYLLVLDDVWNEDRNEWFKLESLLKLGQRGSRILTTSRSKETAKIIGNNLAYNLNGLSREDSWNLFMASAFDDQAEKHIDYLNFVELGKKIVEKCHSVPLAIVVVGRLLYRQEINKWRSLEESGMKGIGNGNNQIMSILKLSYHNLDFSLKRCFSYCALFSKDTQIKKEMLISLWMAQGYIVPFDKGQNLEDAAEEHFWILLQRSFFQDVEKDEYGDVKSIKIHDLMHDVAKDVGLQEICVLSSESSILGDKIRHANVGAIQLPEDFAFKSKIRSIFCSNFEKRIMESQIIGSMMCLRVLHLEYSALEKLPDWIGKLLHLRYLNLSHNHGLQTLPGSITELYNLETLMLYECRKLRELPKDFGKLVKLRHLDLSNCHELTSMPPSMKNLCNLEVLPYFVVGMHSEKQCHGELEILESFINLKGNIHIKIGGNYKDVKGMNNREVGYLKSSKYLMTLNVEFDGFEEHVDQEGVMEKLEPNSNLKVFILENYRGKIIPRWGTTQSNWAVSFPYLVNIRLECQRLQQLPPLSKLRYLKSLVLVGTELEYMEGASDISESNEDDTTTFFPSLEYLQIRCMTRLKGWWRGDYDGIRFPRLSHLITLFCPSLTAIPLPKIPEEEKEVGGLKTLEIDRVDYLKSMFVNRQDDDISLKSLIQSLGSLQFFLVEDEQLPSTANHAQHLTSLHTLNFYHCYHLLTLPEWIGNFSSLQRLSISCCYSLKSLPESITNLTSLQHLSIYYCKALKSLPESMTNLTSLQHLSIRYCEALKSLPDSMTKLTSLQLLEISASPLLEERCRKPNGEDWIKIQHIPNINISYI